jgi:hypothetical protein
LLLIKIRVANAFLVFLVFNLVLGFLSFYLQLLGRAESLIFWIGNLKAFEVNEKVSS